MKKNAPMKMTPKATTSSGLLHKGLSKDGNKGMDASARGMGASVNAGAGRTNVAPTPKTLGPRTA